MPTALNSVSSSGRSPARLRPGRYLADLGEEGVGRQEAFPHRHDEVAGFGHGGLPRIHDDAIHPADCVGPDLLRIQRGGADAVDVGARRESVGAEDRGLGCRGRRDHVRAVDGLVGGRCRLEPGRDARRHIRDEGRDTSGVAIVDAHRRDRPDRADRVQLRPRLDSGADDGQGRGILPGQEVGGEPGGGARAQGGDRARFHGGERRARLGVGEHGQSHDGRETSIRVVREDRDDLHDRRPRPRRVAGHEEGEAAVVEGDGGPNGHHRLAGRVFDVGGADRVDDLPHVRRRPNVVT